MTTLKEAQDFFAEDHFATENGAVIDEIGPDYAVCSMALTAHHRNAAGRVMGGVLFTLADFAFAVAANFSQPPAVTVSSQITFLSPIKGTRLIAKAQQLRRGRTTLYYEVSVTDELGTLAARVTSLGQILNPL